MIAPNDPTIQKARIKLAELGIDTSALSDDEVRERVRNSAKNITTTMNEIGQLFQKTIGTLTSSPSFQEALKKLSEDASNDTGE
ncbi:MAG: hypothetical protein AAGC72_01090 [Planctomycetota bacterium]